LSVVELARDFDEDELMFMANVIYKQKGLLNSIKILFSLINCEYDADSFSIVKTSNSKISLNINVGFENVKDIYLVQKFLRNMCQELLFYTDYDVRITSMSTKYVLTGEVNKQFATYTVYDLTAPIVTETSSEEINNDLTDEDIGTTRKVSETADSKTSVETTVTKDKDTYVVVTQTKKETYKVINTINIDTYEW